MKWFLIIITWYGANVDLDRMRVEFESEGRCERYRTQQIGTLERAKEADPAFGLIIGECTEDPE